MCEPMWQYSDLAKYPEKREIPMKTFNEFIAEQKQTFTVQGQYGNKIQTHEFEAKSHDHAKKMFKAKAKEAGYKFSHVSSVRTKAEEEEVKRKADEFTKEREAKLAKGAQEREKEKEYWDSRQKEYDKQQYKGE